MKLLLASGMPLVLSDKARAFALEMADVFRWQPRSGVLVFTSGQRDAGDQAAAMAANIIASGNRRWIAGVYLYAPVRDALQAWLDANPLISSKGAMANGLGGVLRKFSLVELGKFSKHLSGDAFDVLPRQPSAGITSWLRAREAEGRCKFLDRESGLIRWHVQVG